MVENLSKVAMTANESKREESELEPHFGAAAQSTARSRRQLRKQGHFLSMQLPSVLGEVQNKREIDIYSTNSLNAADIPLTSRMRGFDCMSQKRTTFDEPTCNSSRQENANKIH